MTQIPTLHTERLTLRAATMDDWPAYRLFYQSEAKHEGAAFSEKQAWTLFTGDMGHWALKGFGWFIVDDGTGGVGACGVHHPPHQAEREIGWNTFEAARGKGYAPEAGQAVLDWARTLPDAVPLVSYIYENNAASQAVARKLGARNTRERAVHSPSCEIWRHVEKTAS